jgi:HlyD family secretion protein
MSNSIFREAALERLSTPERLDQGLTVVGSASWALLGGLAALIIGGLIWAVLVVVPVTVKSEGILLSPGGVLDVTSDSPGRVTQFLVQTGDTIKVGQLVAKLDQPDLRQQLAAADGELTDTRNERQQVSEFQQRKTAAQEVAAGQKRQALDDNIAFLVKDIALLDQRGKVEDDLLAKGLITQDRVLQSKVDLGRQQDELEHDRTSLKDLDNDEAKMKADNEHELLNIDLKIAAASRKASELRDRYQLESAVISPYEGDVAEVKVNPGELVERGTALFTLVPKDSGKTTEELAENGLPPAAVGPLIATLYVAPTFGKQVRPGDLVQVAVSTARREEYGFIVGRVRTVAEIPSTAEGMERVLKNKQLVQTMSNNAAPFEVQAELYADPATKSGYRWSSSRGPNLKINSGTLVTADIEVRDLPILSLVIPQTRTPLEKLRRLISSSPQPLNQ